MTAGGIARAVWFSGPRAVELREAQLPELGTSQVRIQALASGISQGTEMLVFRGEAPTSLPLDLPTLEGSFSFPIKYGYAAVGVVVEVGESVEELGEGDLVFVHHPHQAEYVVPAASAVLLPQGIAPETGVFLANLETAVNVILDAHPRFGDRVAVFGLGVVGLLVSLLARRAGARSVMGVDPIASRRERARQLGLDEVLSPQAGAAEAIRELSEGTGADLAIEASGSPEALDLAVASTAFQGTVVVCSWYGSKPVPLFLGGSFHRDRLRMISSQISTLDPALTPRWSVERRRQLAVSLLSELPLERLITHRIPLSSAAEAYRLVDREPEKTLQVVLTYGGSDV